MNDIPVYGQQELSSGNTEFNSLQFLIQRALSRINVATLVQVRAVDPGAGLLVGTVDVLPLVNQVDGAGVAIPHTTLYGLPYLRVQGGNSAFICDPIVGDVGLAVFADRDISSKSRRQRSSTKLGSTIFIGRWFLSRRMEFKDSAK